MRRISTPFEVMLSATLLVLGLYMLYQGSSTKSASEAAMLIGGAVSFTVSLMTLFPAVRSILWHRRMVRHSVTGLNRAASGPNSD